MKRNSTFAGRFALTTVAASALCFTAPVAWALGLGRLQVQSALGETLRAEIDVTNLTPEEASNLRVRIAPPDSYRAAGVEYNAVLPSTQASLQRRADGRSYLRITSDRSVQEPFVDVILELTWSTGRLVREYTLLFDPPTTARASAPPSMPVTPPVIAAAPALVDAVPPPRRTDAKPPRARLPAAEPAAESRALQRPAVAGASTDVDGYKVRAGDSLSRIAGRTQRPGVSLDQMLVSLFQSNPDAFIDNNMNRLKAGVVLTVPSAQAVKSVPPAEAREVIHAQSADFGAYRERLAAGVSAAKTEGTARQASGKVQATVTDRQSGATPDPDKLTLSKGATPDKAIAEERISKERERKASDVRVAELAKNVDELKKLSGVAAATAAASKAAVAPGPSVASAAMPAAASAVVVVATASSASVLLPQPPAAALSPSVVSPVLAPASGVKAAAAPALLQKSSDASAASAATNDPNMFSSLLSGNPIFLGLGALAVLLLGAFAAFRLARRAKRESGETSFLESRLQPDSFFGSSGGQRIDTRDARKASSSTMSYSLSQLDEIGDVDPVAEADVYLAYGRDLQAEEILKEAMRSHPNRMAIRTKLLEVYAKRRDTKGFELLATQLFTLTRGEGEDWAKTQELGHQIDPTNPLFLPGGAPQLVRDTGGQPVEPLGASTMPQSVLPTPSQFDAMTGALPLHSASMALDLDLDLDQGDTVAGTTTSPSPLEVTQAFGPELRLPEHDTMSLDFSLTDLDIPDATQNKPIPSQRIDELPAFDLSDISLDLGEPVTAPGTFSGVPSLHSDFGDIDVPSFDDHDAGNPLAQKLELAEEFRQIGDTEGARDLLREVISQASGAVKTRAQGMLADLG